MKPIVADEMFPDVDIEEVSWSKSWKLEKQ